MPDEETRIFNTADTIVKWTLVFPSDKDWTDYEDSDEYVHIEMYEKNTGTLLQTSGYPSGEGDNDLFVPDTSQDVCYFKVDSANVSGRSGQVEWRLKTQNGDLVFADNYFNPEDRITKFTLE